MQHLEYTVAMAAREHAKKVAHGPTERRAAAVYYLKVIAQEFRGRGYYDLALAADMVRRQVSLMGSLQAVIDVIRPKSADLLSDSQKPQPPASKTGVTPSQIAIQEDFIAGR